MIPESDDDTVTHPRTGLPRPRRGARWRWAAPRGALVGGGVLAAVLGLGAAAGAATNNSPRPAGAAPGASGARGTSPPGGATLGGGRPTVAGRITAIHGDDITVAVRAAPGRSGAPTTATVVYSGATSFKVVSAKSRTASASSSSALKVGAFVAVQGTRHGDTVEASAVVFGVGPPSVPSGGRPAPRPASAPQTG